MNVSDYKIHISLGAIAAIGVFLYTAVPVAYAYFDSYHVDKTRLVMDEEIVLIAAVAKQLELTVAQNTLNELYREEFKIQKSIRESGGDLYTLERLEKVQKHILRLEKQVCGLEGECGD